MVKLTIEQQYIPELTSVRTAILELKDKWFSSTMLIEACGIEPTRSLNVRCGHYLKARGDVHIKSGTNSRLYLLSQ